MRWQIQLHASAMAIHCLAQTHTQTHVGAISHLVQMLLQRPAWASQHAEAAPQHHQAAPLHRHQYPAGAAPPPAAAAAAGAGVAAVAAAGRGLAVAAGGVAGADPSAPVMAPPAVAAPHAAHCPSAVAAPLAAMPPGMHPAKAPRPNRLPPGPPLPFLLLLRLLQPALPPLLLCVLWRAVHA